MIKRIYKQTRRLEKGRYNQGVYVGEDERLNFGQTGFCHWMDSNWVFRPHGQEQVFVIREGDVYLG